MNLWGGYLVHRHIVSSDRKAHAMLPPSYMQGAKCPRPSPTYTYQPGSTVTPGQHPPIHVIFMVAIGRVLPSPSRFCIIEAPAKEWSFNDALVPWILPAGYRNPNETVLDFPEDDEAGSLDKGGSVPLTGLSAEVTTVDDAEEEDDRFVVVGDAEEESGNKVVISISAKEVAKPEGSGLPGKTIMFECLSQRVPMVMTMKIWTRPSGIMKVKRRLGCPGRNRAVRKLRTPILLPYRRVPEIQPVPGQMPHPETSHQPNP